MTTVSQKSFSSGELTPSLAARTDFFKYANGLKTCRNATVMRHGGLTNRPGTNFIIDAKYSDKQTRLIEFIFNDEQTYMMEFGHEYIRLIREGKLITEGIAYMQGGPNTDDITIYSNGHGFVDGQPILITECKTYTALNNTVQYVDYVDANIFNLVDVNGDPVSRIPFNGIEFGAKMQGVYEIPTPYQEEDIFKIRYVQSADVVTLVNGKYPPMELSRLGEVEWTLSELTFKPTVQFPYGISVTRGKTGSKTLKYKVTSISEEGFEESIAGIVDSTLPVISSINLSNPVQVNVPNTTGISEGDEIFLSAIEGTVELNNRSFIAKNVLAGSFELEGEDGTDYTPYISGGIIDIIFAQITGAADDLLVDNPHEITWERIPGAREYNIYREFNGKYGLIGVSSTNSYNDIGVEPDTSETPPIIRNPFVGEANYPSTVTYVQQRLSFGRDNKVFMSRTAKFKNFTTSRPIKDDDAVTFSMVGRQVNEVKHMLDLGRLVILTSGGEWAALGDAAGSIKPLEVNTKQYSYNGSGELQPIVAGGAALYVQARGSIIRDLGFDYRVDGYSGNDITIFSSHLFDKYTLVDWAFQQTPNSIVWAVRDDGVLLGLTFVRDQEMIAWHRHDFEGAKAKSVAVVPEGNEDILYILVEREINGTKRNHIERVATRKILKEEDSIFMDSALTYDGVNTNEFAKVRLTSSSGWSYDEPIVLEDNNIENLFLSVGSRIDITVNGVVLRCKIEKELPDNKYEVSPSQDVPVEFRDTFISEWKIAVKRVTGLNHLEGKFVSVFADNFVVASPNNNSYEKIQVVNGEVELDKAYTKIHVGLPYTSDIETLNIDNPQGETLSDKSILINSLNLHVEETRGIWGGFQKPKGDDPLEGLEEYKLRSDEGYDDPVSLESGIIDINIRGEWNSNGKVFIRQVDPLPMSILSISPSGKIPMR